MLLWGFKANIVNGPLINTLSEGVFCVFVFGVLVFFAGGVFLLS